MMQYWAFSREFSKAKAAKVLDLKNKQTKTHQTLLIKIKNNLKKDNEETFNVPYW